MAKKTWYEEPVDLKKEGRLLGELTERLKSEGPVDQRVALSSQNLNPWLPR